MIELIYRSRLLQSSVYNGSSHRPVFALNSTAVATREIHHDQQILRDETMGRTRKNEPVLNSIINFWEDVGSGMDWSICDENWRSSFSISFDVPCTYTMRLQSRRK